jgi:hypothetical protein
MAMSERSVGRKEAARKALQAIHAKFREGLDTYDLRLATQVLNGSNARGDIVGWALGADAGKGFD